MKITPLIPDGYNGAIKQLTCRICKHIFYVALQEYHLSKEIRFCYECSLVVLEEIQDNQMTTISKSSSVDKEEPANIFAPPSPPTVRVPHLRTINREKMTPEQLFDEAKMLCKTWRYREALNTYEQILLRDATSIEARLGVGSMLIELDLSKEALVVYEELIGLDPGNAQAYNGKGWVHYRLRKYQQALLAFDTALQLDPTLTNASHGKWVISMHLHRKEGDELFFKPENNKIDIEDLDHPCSSAEDYYRRALKLDTLGREEEALHAYEDCLRLDPLYLEVYESISLMHFLKNNHEKSLAAFDRALHVFPDCAKLHMKRAEELCKLKQYKLALEACNRAIDLDAIYIDAYKVKSEVLHHLNLYDDALIIIDQAIARKPHTENLYIQKAKVLASLQQYDQALDTYDKAINLDPDHFHAYGEKARVLANIQRYEDAIAVYDQFIERNPFIYKGYEEKLFFLSMRQRYTDGLRTCDDCLVHNPRQIKAHSKRGQMLTLLKRYEDAILAYEQAILLQPQCESFHIEKARALISLKRHEEALTTFDDVISINADYVLALKEKGSLLKDLKRYEEALPLLKKASQLKSDDAHLHHMIGDVLCELEQYEKAIKSYDRVIRPRSAKKLGCVYRSKASALEKMGKNGEAISTYEKALTAYDKAICSEPKDFYSLFFKADVLKQLCRYEEANACYNKAEYVAPHPLIEIYCLLGKVDIELYREAKARLQAAGQEIKHKNIKVEVELIRTEKKIQSLKSSILFNPLCTFMQEKPEWNGTAKQFKDVLRTDYPEALRGWYRSPYKFVEELKKIIPALQDEGIDVLISEKSATIYLIKKL